MEYRRLGQTELQVSSICLGTMTWGSQNNQADGHAQMDYAFEQGVTFWDTAEMYAVPPHPNHHGTTETIIGEWFKRRGLRQQVILASKVIGANRHFHWVRGGNAKLDRANITQALEDSLQRLQTDYIDLYQLHWPDRSVNSFGQREYLHKPEQDGTPLAETLAVLRDLINQGKIRHIGVSNETPWGVMTALKLSETAGLLRIVSVQNPYNLLSREYEIGLSEISLRENCGLLAYSPLAGGDLSGKYLRGARPAGSRRVIWPGLSRYARGEDAIAAYVNLANRHNLDPSQMALSYVHQKDFVTSVIIGATSMLQLEIDIASAEVKLSPAVIEDIEEIQRQHPNPCT